VYNCNDEPWHPGGGLDILVSLFVVGSRDPSLDHGDIGLVLGPNCQSMEQRFVFAFEVVG
jgi:hypothetical protein